MTDKFHPETLALGDALKSINLRPYYEHPSLDSAREQSRQVHTILAGSYDFDGKRTEEFIPAQHIPGVLPVYVYKPNHLPENPAIVVYFHGGGMTVGSRENVDILCKIISSRAKCIFVNVEYRLAPEYKFPGSFDDAVCATKWVLDNKKHLGGSSNSKVGIAGDSAGAILSASAAHDVSGLDFQILIYPKVTSMRDYSLPSYEEFKNGPILTLQVIEWFNDQFGLSGESEHDPRYAVLYRPSFNHLPPALLIVAGADPIRDDSYEYAKKLTEAGVHNELLLVKGAAHGFFGLPGHFKECCKEAHEKTVEFIKKFGTVN